jgi:ClpA/ClpB-like protein/S1 RNA binding family protein/HAAS domain-containing protein
MADRIERYLARLRQELRVNLLFRERILEEIADHLLEGAEREQEKGASPEEAQRRVIERFGDVEAVARWWSEVYAGEKGESPMWQRFTERARRVVFYAQEEAARLGENFVGTEHLLLGLLREGDSVAGRLLEERLGISLAILRIDTEQQVTRGAGNLGQDMQLTPRAKQMIDLAYEEARSLGNNYIGTEHLLLGLIREEGGLAGRVLRGRGATLERTRETVRAFQEQESDEALMRGVKAQFSQAVERAATLSVEALALIDVLNLYDPERIVHALLAHLKLTPEQRQELGAIRSHNPRLKRLLDLLRTEDVPLEITAESRRKAAEPPAPAAAPPDAMTDADRTARRAIVLGSLAEGQTREGIVREIVHAGAVLDLGGVNAWLPVEEMSWTALDDPSHVMKAGDILQVMVLQLDAARGKVVVGRRQLLPAPPYSQQEGGDAAP